MHVSTCFSFTIPSVHIQLPTTRFTQPDMRHGRPYVPHVALHVFACNGFSFEVCKGLSISIP